MSGLPTLFPSLGPSAFVLAHFPDAESSDPHRVVLGHAVGVVAGLTSYHLLAPGVVVTDPIATLSATGLELAASGTVAVGLTAAGMLWLDASHPPACATTLIVALGLLSTPVQGVLIVGAVGVMVGVQETAVRVRGRLHRLGHVDEVRSWPD